MVLHDHQSQPARAHQRAGRVGHGKRLNPRKADLHRWRRPSPRSCVIRDRGRSDPPGDPRAGQNHDTLWRLKARQTGACEPRGPGNQGHGRSAGDASAGRRSLDARGQGAGCCPGMRTTASWLAPSPRSSRRCRPVRRLFRNRPRRKWPADPTYRRRPATMRANLAGSCRRRLLPLHLHGPVVIGVVDRRRLVGTTERQKHFPPAAGRLHMMQ